MNIEEELENTFKELVKVQDRIKREGMLLNTSPVNLKDMQGQFLLAPVLIAKANVLSALATLKANRNATPSL